MKKYKKNEIFDIIEQDIHIRVPPIKKYTIWIEIKKIEKAKPRIVIPEYLLNWK